MKDQNDKLNRREVLKGIAVGVGTASTLPVLNTSVFGHDHAHQPGSQELDAAKEGKLKSAPSKFFNSEEMAIITVISELIIPADDRSKGAKEAEVPAFIDLMVSESPEEIKVLWRDGLKAVEAKSQSEFSKSFTSASPEQQTSLLTEMSKNEQRPQTLVERFFRAIKNLTIDGYYTSEIGIHKELQYKGNAYLKEFKGCTHPEHQV